MKLIDRSAQLNLFKQERYQYRHKNLKLVKNDNSKLPSYSTKSYGRIVQTPLDVNGNSYEDYPFCIHMRVDGLYVVWRKDKGLGKGRIVVVLTLTEAINIYNRARKK
jgi:hypothetical protein